MSGKAFRLAGTIGRSYAVDPDDTRRIKLALKDLGYLRPPAYGLTPYPDERMFRGIERFQEDFGLRRDGIVKPDGETAVKLADALAGQQPTPAARGGGGRSAPIAGPSSTPSEPGSPPPGGGAKEQQVAVAPALPVIVYEIAAFFGMSVAAAYAWWISLSDGAKKEIRSKVEMGRARRQDENAPSEEECEELNRIDTRTCNQIGKRRGAAAGRRCHASASERYSACLRGRPRDRWPPLDTWNN